jgi:NADH-quinone oxidoreductase subunit E
MAAQLEPLTMESMEFSAVDRIVEGFRHEKASLVMILQDVQEAYNYLPEPVLERVAELLRLPRSHVYNVATFYSSFSLKERGRHIIRVCDGTACHLCGAANLKDEVCRQLDIDVGETSKDKLFSLELVACLGACALAPVMAVGQKFYGEMTPEKIKKTLNSYRRLKLK